MEKTKVTKKYKSLSIIFSILTNYLPVLFLIGFVVYGLVTGDDTNKIAMSGCIVAAIVLSAFQVLAKLKFRCIPYILLIGIYLCMNNILIVLLCFTIYTILDDFCFSPLYKKFKNKYTINYEMDKRGVK